MNNEDTQALATDDADRDGRRLPILLGGDKEVGNFILGPDGDRNTAGDAALALLREFDGVPHRRPSGHCQCEHCRSRRERERENGDEADTSYDPQDRGRKYLGANGGCAYIDLNHLELALPEVLGAHEFVAVWHGMLRLLRRAMVRANRRLPDDHKLHVLVNNSDGRGRSYGSHLNFLISEPVWDDLFYHKLHYMLFLVSQMVSSIVVTGQGKVGSENGRKAVKYQIGQRADFFEILQGSFTTFRRPIFNTRDEAHCGRSFDSEDDSQLTLGMHRLHVINFDGNLCHVSNLLKVGCMQIVLAMIAAEKVDSRLLLENPVRAFVRWSHDPSLRRYRAPLISGKKVTATELQLLILEQAKPFVESGGCDGIVPRAREILALWEDTLVKLHAREMESLVPRLDWVLKRHLIERAMDAQPRLDWGSPEIKHLDHLYSSLDPDQGLYWAMERAGATEQVVEDVRVERYTSEPPETTRAWTRAMLLRHADRSEVEEINWDLMEFRLRGKFGARVTRKLRMSNPLRFTRAEVEPLIANAKSFEEILDLLGAEEPGGVLTGAAAS